MLFHLPKLWLLATETGVLLVFFGIAWLALRYLTPFAGCRVLSWLLGRQWRGVLFIVAVALLGRAILLPVIGVPAPRVNDEFAHLLAADTFSHHRLANPTPAAWPHFETFHVNLRPTYHSMYPPAQGLTLAAGQVLFHTPWIGVYLGTALMCGAIFWALRAFFSPGWALLGGLLAVSRFAFFGYWMNSYWGGSVAALGGAVAVGAVVRLGESGRSAKSRAWLSLLFVIGLVVLANSRPYEGLALSLPLFGYLLYEIFRAKPDRRLIAAMLLPGFALGCAGLALMGIYNHATTGDILLMPYSLNHRVYWPFPFFMGQKENAAASTPDPVFASFFRETAQSYEYEKSKSISGIASLQVHRGFENWLFYVGPALTFPVIIGILSSLRQSKFGVVLLVFGTVLVAMAFCIYNLPHYFAPATFLVYLFAVEGLRYLWDTRQVAERAFAVAACATALVTSALGATASATLYSRYALVDARQLVSRQLEQQPGRYLVLVSYDLDRHYPGAELVHNGADFGSARILWGRSKGAEADAKLCSIYPDRKMVSVTTDDVSVSIKSLDSCK